MKFRPCIDIHNGKVKLVLGMLCIFTACGTDKNKNENDMAGNTNTTENGTTNNNAGTGNGTTNGTVGSNTPTMSSVISDTPSAMSSTTLPTASPASSKTHYKFYGIFFKFSILNIFIHSAHNSNRTENNAVLI